MSEVSTPAVPTASTTPVKPGLPVKPTEEEQSKRLRFVGMCVDRNIVYPDTTKFGASNPMTVQDLCAANVTTLQRIAKALKKAEADHDPEFNSTEELKVAKVPARQWLDFLRLTIRQKDWKAYTSDLSARRKDIKAQLEQARTPEERRKDLEAELSSMGTADEED